jgi:hypothetical protein
MNYHNILEIAVGVVVGIVALYFALVGIELAIRALVLLVKLILGILGYLLQYVFNAGKSLREPINDED